MCVYAFKSCLFKQEFQLCRGDWLDVSGIDVKGLAEYCKAFRVLRFNGQHSTCRQLASGVCDQSGVVGRREMLHKLGAEHTVEGGVRDLREVLKYIGLFDG